LELVVDKKRKYRLVPHTQVREEDFGLLFYTMEGPWLYFLSCGQMLDVTFFEGDFTLNEWLEKKGVLSLYGRDTIAKVERMLEQLREKGVIC